MDESLVKSKVKYRLKCDIWKLEGIGTSEEKKKWQNTIELLSPVTVKIAKYCNNFNNAIE